MVLQLLYLVAACMVASAEAQKEPGQVQFRRWQHQGVERLHLLYAPLSAQENSSLPLWLLCPGTNVDALSMLSITDLTSLSERFSIAVAVLEGLDLRLNVDKDARASNADGRPDDVSYTKAVIADAVLRIGIDDQQVYCIGSSRGARFCSRLASELAPPLAGLLLNAGLRFPRPNNASQLPIIAIHDSKDTVNPYHGGGAAYWQESVPDVVEAWASFNRCSSKSQQQLVPTALVGPAWLQRHVRCERFAEVWLMVTETGRHAWPGNGFTEIGWKFLQRQTALQRGEVIDLGGEDWPDWPLYRGGARSFVGIWWLALVLGFTSTA